MHRPQREREQQPHGDAGKRQLLGDQPLPSRDDRGERNQRGLVEVDGEALPELPPQLPVLMHGARDRVDRKPAERDHADHARGEQHVADAEQRRADPTRVASR